jgi:hypothetical protein
LPSHQLLNSGCRDNEWGTPVVLPNTPELRIEIAFFNNEKSVVNFQFLRFDNDWIGPIYISKQLVYYDALSPANRVLTGDTLTTEEKNRPRSSFYVYGNTAYPPDWREVHISAIKKITVLHW